jgi:hypothetical protein
MATSPNIRARPEDYPVNDDNSPIKVVNFNGVGGFTIVYTAHFPRLHPSDFRVRTLDGVAEDWPIGYDTLAPFFAENDRMMGVSGLAGDPAFPPTDPPMMLHPYAQAYGYVDEPTNSNRAPPTCLWSKEFYETDPSRGFVRGYALQFGRGIGPVMEAVSSEAKGLLPWGAGHHAAFRRLNGHLLGLSAICEDLPEEHNRVTLDPILKDSHGILAPPRRLHHRREQRANARTRHCTGQGNSCRRGGRLISASIVRSCMAAGICLGRCGWA